MLLVLLIAFSDQAEGAEVLMRTTVEDRGMSVGTERGGAFAQPDTFWLLWR